MVDQDLMCTAASFCQSGHAAKGDTLSLWSFMCFLRLDARDNAKLHWLHLFALNFTGVLGM